MPKTLCQDCENCDDSAKHPAYWMCKKHPRAEGFGFVTADVWDNAPPFLFCKDVNGGFCPLFKPKRNGQKELV